MKYSACIFLLCVLANSLSLLLANRLAASSSNKFTSQNYIFDELPCGKVPGIEFENSRDFSLGDAYMLMLTYWLLEKYDDDVVGDQMIRWGFDDYRILSKNNGFRAMVASHKDYLLVVFNGTAKFRQALSNANFFTKNLEGLPGKVHRGFASEYLKSQELVEQSMRDLNPGSKPVVFAGHSRGAAVAKLNALKLLNSINIRSVYSFASPRLGDSQLVDAIQDGYGSHLFQINLAKDITTQVPPTQDASEVFTDVLGPQLGFLRKPLERVARGLEYSYAAGNVYTIYDSGVLTNVTNIQEDIQNTYWTQLSRDLENKGFMGVIQTIQSFPKSHKPEAYLCSLANILK
ncbi:MAG: hypothetical protein HRU19_16945 [Pseudobacteriovorax sp.]|nr:hypothetical protein [Pseudobacteriovorax sp.]